MAITRHISYGVQCDNCGLSPFRTYAVDEAEAAAYAKRIGWLTSTDGVDLCRSCADLESEAS